MKIAILSVGKLKNKNISIMCNDFKHRISFFCNVEEIIIKDTDNKTENQKIVNYLQKDSSFKIALSEEGKKLTSKTHFYHWRARGPNARVKKEI